MRQRGMPLAGIVTGLGVLMLLVFAAGSRPAAADEFVDVQAGGLHTCGLTAADGMQCWGRNEEGQVGIGAFTESEPWPVAVPGLESGLSAIAVGEGHTCALTSADGVKCWGRNNYGQVGDGTMTNRETPVDVVGLTSGVDMIAAGGGHVCAVMTAGGVKCWGHNTLGSLGDGTFTHSAVPVDVTGLSSGVVAIAAGGHHTCVLMNTGGLKCWGSNRSGELGDGTTTDRAEPVDVVGLTSGVASVDAGADHTCAVTTAGGLKCWGSNLGGQLGNDDLSAEPSLTPVDVVGLGEGVAAVATGDGHTCAVTTDGALQCWGWDGFGQLGDGTPSLIERSAVPGNVVGLGALPGQQLVAIASGGAGHTCVVTDAGVFICWGWNSDGQLGDGTATDSASPMVNDFDRDACYNENEASSDETKGGQRNPKYFWDFFDTPDENNVRDRVVNIVDVYRVQARYYASGDPNIDPLSTPPPPPAYHTAFDRTVEGPNLWNLGPPNGHIGVDDILNAVRQNGHDCRTPMPPPTPTPTP